MPPGPRSTQIDDTRSPRSTSGLRCSARRGERRARTQSATARVQQESEEARAALDRDASDLANAIVTRVLDRAS